jgi:hypothetical protein
VKETKDILVYGTFVISKSLPTYDISLFACLGAGLYSFFVVSLVLLVCPNIPVVTIVQQNYSTACTATRNCQEQLMNVDRKSDVSFYSLSTVATTYQLSIDARGVIDQKDNVDGFASTVTVWTRD